MPETKKNGVGNLVLAVGAAALMIAASGKQQLTLSLGPDLTVQMEPDGTVSVVGPVIINRPPTSLLFRVVTGPAATFDISVPNEVRYNLPAVGEYEIEAQARDADGMAIDRIHISVTNEPAPTLTGLVIDQTTGSVQVGGTFQFTATAQYSDGTLVNATNQASWSSGNPAVATVATAGLAQGVAAGVAVIQASLGGFTDAIDLTVTALPTVPPTVSLGPDQTVQLPDPALLTYSITAPNPVTKSWLILNSPPGASLMDETPENNSGSAILSLTEPGDYTLLLTVTDQVTGLQASADVFVTALGTTLPITSTPLTTDRKLTNVMNAPNVGVTAQVTIPANHLAVLWLAVGNVSGGDPQLIESSGRPWTLVGKSTILRGLYAYRSLQPNQTTGSVQITIPTPQAGTTDPHHMVWALNVHGGVAQGGINGAGAIGVIASRNSLLEGGGFSFSADIPFPVAPGPNDAIAAGFAIHQNALPAFPGGGFTLLANAPVATLTVQTESRPDFANHADMAWTNLSHFVGIAFAIRRP